MLTPWYTDLQQKLTCIQLLKGNLSYVSLTGQVHLSYHRFFREDWNGSTINIYVTVPKYSSVNSTTTPIQSLIVHLYKQNVKITTRINVYIQFVHVHSNAQGKW